jgi:hypothetical protein
VTAYEWSQAELQCNAPRCYERFTGERGLRPTSGETPAAVRKRAGKAGWTHVRSNWRRQGDRDYCPLHKPAEAAQAAGTEKP